MLEDLIYFRFHYESKIAVHNLIPNSLNIADDRHCLINPIIRLHYINE